MEYARELVSFLKERRSITFVVTTMVIIVTALMPIPELFCLSRGFIIVKLPHSSSYGALLNLPQNALKTTIMTLITFIPVFILLIAVRVGFGDYKYVTISGSILAILGIAVTVSYTTLGVLTYTDCLNTVDVLNSAYNGTIEWSWDAKYYLFIANCLLQYASILMLFSLGLFFLHCLLSVEWRHKHGLNGEPYRYAGIIEICRLSYNENSKSVRVVLSENIEAYLESKCPPVIYNSCEQDNETEDYLRNTHRQRCRYHFPFYPLLLPCCRNRNCSWSELRIRIKTFGWETRETFKNMILQFGLLNKVDIHFFTTFHFKPSQCFLDYINFSRSFLCYYEPITEVLMLREDGFSFIRCLRMYANDSPERHALHMFINKTLLSNSPPPLWFFCLQKVRLMIRNRYSNFLWNVSENALMYKDFVLNPAENTHIQDIYKVLNLSYKDYWLSQQSKFGLLEDLNELESEKQTLFVQLPLNSSSSC
ncbi:DgyrCDS2624 [Dimorphilus gyrociliatus]|uniref:DgyrCDS2624 n=1 Tax=Dimorphilus gyrociliatus TaxID=2664684 RepID=A0A7I8VCT3_9ANNE|nr:DgyrCDS2624 [Dimorphilus gyrociliatus]